MNSLETRPAILLIDDEERILRSLEILFRGRYRLHITTDPQTALTTIAREPVHVVVSDQRMPLMSGADLLREVRRLSPNTMRILLTGYSELDAIVASVNEGEIFRYVNKPWLAAELRSTVEQASGIAMQMFAASQQAMDSRIPEPAAANNSAILVIDDDVTVFSAVKEIVGYAQRVHYAQSLEQAFMLLEREPIGVIISELMVARESLTTALKMLKSQHPEVVTIVMTPFRDTAVLVGLINQGQVYRILPKPLRAGPLGMNIASALRQHRLLSASPVLRQRHAVEQISAPEEISVANRMMSFLGRLRGRTTVWPPLPEIRQS